MRMICSLAIFNIVCLKWYFVCSPKAFIMFIEKRLIWNRGKHCVVRQLKCCIGLWFPSQFMGHYLSFKPSELRTANYSASGPRVRPGEWEVSYPEIIFTYRWQHHNIQTTLLPNSISSNIRQHRTMCAECRGQDSVSWWFTTGKSVGVDHKPSTTLALRVTAFRPHRNHPSSEQFSEAMVRSLTSVMTWRFYSSSLQGGCGVSDGDDAS